MKELTVQEWFEEINRGLEYRKLFGIESTWAELEALFYNVHDSNAHQGPNIIYSTGDALMSTMSVPYPYITVKPKRMEFTAPSRLREQIDNELIDDLDIPDEVEQAVLSAYLWGPGILKIGYDSEFGWDPSMDLGLMHKMPLGMTLTQFSKNQQRIEFGGPDPGMPWVKRVLPHDFVVPWGTGARLDEAPWCAHRVIRHIDDCRADVKYKTRGLRPVMSMKDFVTSYQKVAPTYRVGDDITRGINTQESGDQEYVELWEIHDRRTQKIYVIATGYDSFLRNEHDYLQVNGLPFVAFSLVPRSRNFWTTSDAYYLRQAQAESAEIALQASKHRKASVLKFLYAEDALEEDALDNFFSSETGIGVRINGGTQPLNQSVMAMQPPQDMQCAQQDLAVRRNAQELVGFSRNQMGEYEQTGRRTATEANIVSQASSLRMDRRQSVLSKTYLDIFRKIDPITDKYWTTPKWTELTGPDGAPQMLQFVGSQLKGEFKYSLGFSLQPQETIQQRRQNAIQLYMSLRQDPLMNPFALAKYLNMAYNDPEFTSIFGQGVLNGQAEQQLAMQQQQAQVQGGPGNQGGGQPVGGVSLGGNTPRPQGPGLSGGPQPARSRT